MTEKYQVESIGSEGIMEVFAKALELAKKHNCNITLCVPAIKEALNTPLTEVLGKDFIQPLVAGKTLILNNHPIAMKSNFNICKVAEAGILVLLWTLPEQIHKIEKTISFKAIVTLPYRAAEGVEQA